MMDDSVEEWKPVVGFEGYYDVSSCGKIYSHHSKRILVPQIDSRGYPSITLVRWEPRKKRSYDIHLLMARAFFGPSTKRDNQVNHKDGVKTNNGLSNLEYVTPKVNQRHAWRIGLQQKRYGEKCPTARLTTADIVAIRQLRGKMSQAEIGRLFNTSQTNIGKIQRREAWPHIP